MKIIEIKPRRKFVSGIVFDQEVNSKEYGADCDAAGLLCLDSELCEIKHLKAGVNLSEDQLTDLVRQSHIKRAKSRAMWYMSRSDCSRKTLVDKLNRSFPEYASVIAADRMEELGFLNDESYAKRRIQKIIDEKKVSVNLAKQLLKSEGIESELVDLAAEDAEYDSVTIIVELINKKYKAKLGDKQQNDKVIAALMRKGHRFSDIKEALSKFVENSESEEYSEDY